MKFYMTFAILALTQGIRLNQQVVKAETAGDYNKTNPPPANGTNSSGNGTCYDCYGNNTGNATAAGNYTQRNIDEDAMMIAEDILVRMDKNADGVITWPEVKGAVRADMKSMRQEMIRYYKDQFRAADVDGDKKVTMEELVNSIKQQMTQHQPRPEPGPMQDGTTNSKDMTKK